MDNNNNTNDDAPATPQSNGEHRSSPHRIDMTGAVVDLSEKGNVPGSLDDMDDKNDKEKEQAEKLKAIRNEYDDKLKAIQQTVDSRQSTKLQDAPGITDPEEEKTEQADNSAVDEAMKMKNSKEYQKSKIRARSMARQSILEDRRSELQQKRAKWQTRKNRCIIISFFFVLVLAGVFAYFIVEKAKKDDSNNNQDSSSASPPTTAPTRRTTTGLRGLQHKLQLDF